MKMNMATAALDRITGGRAQKAIKYSMVSVVGVTITQVLLLIFYGLLDWEATAANIVSVSLCSIPVFFLNKHWVWGKAGRAHVRREVLPFWGFSLAGLILSTIAVSIVDDWSESHLVVSAANISGFAVLWVAKFLFLDAVLFSGAHTEEGALPG
jgi:putative flippase GtrA